VNDRSDPRQVEVWGIWLDATEPMLTYYSSTLSKDEHNRVEQSRFEKLKRAYTLSRGALRVLLGHYLGCLPNEIELTFGPKGKPALLSPSRLRFNASHSGQMALYAFTLDCDMGIDVEKIRELDDLESIAARFFSAAEVFQLRSLPPDERALAFFRCWTRKEAYVKAIGDGLAMPLNGFQVTLLPGAPARLVHISTGLASDWTLEHLDLAPGYIGALAYRYSPRPTAFHPLVRADDLPGLLQR
jgi:4'-phosphopantetheinyl transferase